MNTFNPVMKYCPKCSAAVLKPCDKYAYFCSECGFKFYLNVAAATVAIIFDKQNRLLTVIRANDPAKGSLDLPGGFVDPFETAEQAIQREIKEELNLTVTEVRYLYSFPNQYPFLGIVYNTLDAVFLCKIEDFSPIQANDDVSGFRWLDIKDLHYADFGLNSIRRIVQQLKESL